jgi:hypothetical protein
MAGSRQGKNNQLHLVDLFRQSVNSRIAGYQDVTGAERLSQDPAFRLIGSGKIREPEAVLISRRPRRQTPAA